MQNGVYVGASTVSAATEEKQLHKPVALGHNRKDAIMALTRHQPEWMTTQQPKSFVRELLKGHHDGVLLAITSLQIV